MKAASTFMYNCTRPQMLNATTLQACFALLIATCLQFHVFSCSLCMVCVEPGSTGGQDVGQLAAHAFLVHPGARRC